MHSLYFEHYLNFMKIICLKFSNLHMLIEAMNSLKRVYLLYTIYNKNNNNNIYCMYKPKAPEMRQT